MAAECCARVHAPSRRWCGSVVSFRTGCHDIMTALKGLSITATSTVDKAAQLHHDLFSHPYSYQWHGTSHPLPGHQVSREKLFSEPAAPHRAAHSVPDSKGKRPPRDPFGRAPLDTRNSGPVEQARMNHSGQWSPPSWTVQRRKTAADS